MSQYHDAETLEQARYIASPAVTAVQVALNHFWWENGKPTAQLVEMLQAAVTKAVRQELASFFGGVEEEA